MAAQTETVAGSDIVALLIDTIGSQADLLLGLSAAICGGIVALVIQVAIHNRGGDTKITIAGSAILLLACIAEGVSMFYGYSVRGTLAGSLPALYHASYKVDKALIYNDLDPIQILQSQALSQFYWFIGGLGLLLLLVLFNRRIMVSS
jgi:hypothetical protein